MDKRDILALIGMIAQAELEIAELKESLTRRRQRLENALMVAEAGSQVEDLNEIMRDIRGIPDRMKEAVENVKRAE